ncbi:MAG: hypothetical protein KJ597_06365 [Nanoarchaeota archaeon]|nr:hypothetical protein [Nanoarchaeota archaeon]MBU1623171.1 hypothetical protein [Nanoarchaeota archaeon]
MLLIKEIIPEKYSLFTELVYDATDRNYKNVHQKVYQYPYITLEKLVELINKILKINETDKFLLKEEVSLLNYAQRIFTKKKNNISFDQYAKLFEKILKTLIVRLLMIQQKMYSKLKDNKLQASKEDHEYLFALENIFEQIDSISKEFKEKEFDRAWIMKAIFIFKHLHALVQSITFNDYKAVSSISNSILSYDEIKYDISAKIVA